MTGFYFKGIYGLIGEIDNLTNKYNMPCDVLKEGLPKELGIMEKQRDYMFIRFLENGYQGSSERR